MPHAELHHSADLDIDAAVFLAEVEQLILRHDADSGETKGRCYPIATFRHTHCVLRISMLSKPHRDQAFSERLLEDLERMVQTAFPGRRFFYSVDLSFSGDFYVTGEQRPEAEPAPLGQ